MSWIVRFAALAPSLALSLVPSLALSLALALLPGCRDDRRSEPEDTDPAESDLGQRVFQPSPGVVRAVPPHGIKQGGVGPYLLGAELREVLAMLPHGPRVELLDIENVVKYSLVRAEEGRVLIGVGSSGRVSFIGVLAPDIAKTTGGLGVGATEEELVEQLGPVVNGPDVRDPRVLVLEQLPGARVVMEDGEASVIVVGPGGAGAPPAVSAQPDALSGGEASPAPGATAPGTPAPPGRPAPEVPAAPRPAETPATPCGRAAEILAAAPLAAARGDEAHGAIAYGCFTGNSPEAVVPAPGELVLHGGDPARLRRITSVEVPGLLFAGALDLDGDQRHELVAFSERRTAEQVSVRVQVLRGEGGKLMAVADEEVYRATSTTVAWVGARLVDVHFLLRAEPRASAIEVHGLYLDKGGGVERHVAPLIPRTVSVRPRRKPPEGSGSGGAAASPAAGGGSGGGKTKPAGGGGEAATPGPARDGAAPDRPERPSPAGEEAEPGTGAGRPGSGASSD